MSVLFLKAYWNLIRFDVCLARGNFAALYERVRRQPCRWCPATPHTVENVCRVVDNTCVWYWKEVLCLQRSALTTCLLKESGVRAELVIGAQQLPFKAHAWVEVDGTVVNDKPYVREIYAVLDRC
jgi:hypothetical protein